MHAHHAAFFQFREITQSLTELSEAQQILRLKFELLRALERASDGQSRSRALEARIAELKAETQVRTQEHQAFAAEHHRQLREATRELARTQEEGAQKLTTMRMEILSIESQCEVLDDICRSLLRTIEEAASPELAADAPTEPARHARVSA
jgi:hypothetical protein